MKKYISHLFLFLLVIFIVQILKVWCTPFYWGRARMAHKVNYLLENSDKYNTYIMGSSKVHSNYDPIEFDRALPSNFGINTFNLGCNGSTFDENYYILKNILPRLGNPEYILFQVTRPRKLAINDTETIERRYFMDLDVMKQLLRSFRGKEIRKSIYQKYLLNIFSTGESLRRIRNLKMVSDYNKISPLLSIVHGYFDTSKEIDDWVVTGRNKRENMNYEKLLSNQLAKHKITDAHAYQPDQDFLDWLYNIKDMCKHFGIEIIFFSVPNEEYTLPNDLNYIYMGDGVDNPEYFKLENHLDHVHVFKQGAAIYSKSLASKFKSYL